MIKPPGKQQVTLWIMQGSCSFCLCPDSSPKVTLGYLLTLDEPAYSSVNGAHARGGSGSQWRYLLQFLKWLVRG